jgi:hypothetical protein
VEKLTGTIHILDTDNEIDKQALLTALIGYTDQLNQALAKDYKLTVVGLPKATTDEDIEIILDDGSCEESYTLEQFMGRIKEYSTPPLIPL